MKNNKIRKGLVLGIIVLFVGVSVIPSSGMVEKSNKGRAILYVGGSGPGNYTKIQDAIDDASDGDTVFVYDDSSPYYENTIIAKSISLVGENKDTTVVDGGGNNNVVYISVDWVNISGFTIENAGNFGIWISYSSNNIISNCNVRNNLKGIMTSGSNNNNISGNNINFNEYEGIRLANSIDNSISNNTISFNGWVGIYSWNSSYNMISENTISSNGDGLYAYESGIWLDDSNSNEILKNNFCSNTRDGIFLISCNNNDILENYFSENLYGLRLWDSNENIIEGNYVNSSNYYGISLSQSSNDNKMFHNNYVNNEYNSWDECSNAWDNGYPSGGNYWDDYEGTDEDGDRIGDTPYNISGGDNQDLYPLMKPYGTPFADFNYYANNRTFDGSLSYDVDGEIVMYEWDFDDGSTGIGRVVTHVYDESAIYNVTLTVTDDDGYLDSIMKSIEVEGNYAPEPPVINGQKNGKVGKLYPYTFVSEDPNGDDVFYYIDWGDGVDDWFGPYPSNEQIIVNHSWSEKGDFTIMARAKDIYDAIGDWGTLEVTMPKGKQSVYSPFLQFLQNLIQRFPILEQILLLFPVFNKLLNFQ